MIPEKRRKYLEGREATAEGTESAFTFQSGRQIRFFTRQYVSVRRRMLDTTSNFGKLVKALEKIHSDVQHDISRPVNIRFEGMDRRHKYYSRDVKIWNRETSHSAHLAEMIF